MNEYELIFYKNGTYRSDAVLIESNSMDDAIDKFLKEQNLNVRTKRMPGKNIDTNCSYILIWKKGTQRDKYAMYHGAYGQKYCYLVEDVTVNEQVQEGRKE